MKTLKKGVRTDSCLVPITTLTPLPFKLKRDIPVLVQSDGEDYIARFVDANIGASGETLSEAIDGLKEVMTMTFYRLMATPHSKLGPEPRRQKAVLKEFIEAKGPFNGKNHHQRAGRENRR